MRCVEAVSSPEGVCQGSVNTSRFEQCQFLDSISVWTVSLFRQCHCLGNVTVWTVIV